MESCNYLWIIAYVSNANRLVLYLFYCRRSFGHFLMSQSDFKHNHLILTHFLFQINHNENVLVSSVTMIEVTYAFGTIFITCELCQRVNLAFDECSDIIDQFDWYLLPAKIQRIMPMVIHFTQQPIEIKGFGSASANRDTFKRVSTINVALSLAFNRRKFVMNLGFYFQVVKTAFSYFMVLRQFYN